MGTSLVLAQNWLRDYATAGVAGSGGYDSQGNPIPWNPLKTDGIATISDVDTRLTALEGGQTSATIVQSSWAALSITPGTFNGEAAAVYGDSGTHSDQVTGATVSNTGLYSWVASSSKWQWISNYNLSSLWSGVSQSTPSGGELFPSCVALSIFGTSGGATQISDNVGNPIGFTIPVGQTGRSTMIAVYPITRPDEIAALAGRTIQITCVMTATAGFLTKAPLNSTAVDIGRNQGITGGSVISVAQSGTTITRVVAYTVSGTESAIGIINQVDLSPGPQTTQLTLTVASVSYNVAGSASASGPGGETVSRAIASQASSRFALSVYKDLGDNIGALANSTTWLTDPKTNYINGFSIPAGSYGGASYLDLLYNTGAEDIALIAGSLIRMTFVMITSSGNGRIINPVIFWANAVTGGGLTNQYTRVVSQPSTTRRVVVVEGVVDPSALRLSIIVQNGYISGGSSIRDVITGTTDWFQVQDILLEILSPADKSLNPADATTRLILNQTARQARKSLSTEAYLRSTDVTVASSGASYTTLAAAISAARPGYRIRVAAGQTFNETLVYPTVDELTIESYGASDRPTVQFFQADNVATANTVGNSASDIHKSVVMRNMRVLAKNARYACHADAANHDFRQNMLFESCHFEHLGNQGAVTWQTNNSGSPGSVWSNCSSFGFGIGDGGELTLRDSTFVGYGFDACLGHNWGSFSNACRITVENCRFVVNNPSGSRVNSFYFANIGSGTPDVVYFRGNQLNGPIMCGSYPWQVTDPSLVPAYKMLFRFTGTGNTPAPYLLDDDGSRALRITSSSSGTSSSVVVSGTAVPVLFGTAKSVQGAAGLSGYVLGWLDVGDHMIGNSGNQDVVKLGARLGDKTSSSVTLTVTVDGGSPVNIVLNQNYTSMSSSTILGVINTALGSSATATLFNANDLFRPEFLDEEIRVINTGSTTILRKTAVAFNGSTTSGRVMTSSDAAYLFAGIAYEDIPPGSSGRVKKAGQVRVSVDMIRSDSGGFTAGRFFGVGSTTGQFTLNPAVPLLTAVNTVDVQFGVDSGGDMSSWTSFSPTVTSQTGTITTLGAVSGRYLKNGRHVSFVVSAAITTNGTGAGGVVLSGLPVNSAAIFTFIGRESGNTGKAVLGYMNPSTGYIICTYYDGTYPGGNGNIITIQGQYEASA